MWVPSLGREDPMEVEMATHCSLLARRIPMDRGPWRATYSPWGHEELEMTKRVHTPTHTSLEIPFILF